MEGKAVSVEKRNTNAFSSSFGFIVTIVGFAIGVGTIWRFPYLLGENGGFFFLLVYVVLLLAIGIPVMCAEVSLGFKTQKTAIKAYQELAPKKPWYSLGILHVIAIITASYTVTVNTWAMKYLWLAITNKFSGLDPSGIEALFGEVMGDGNGLLPFLLIYVAIIAVILLGGVKGGIERANKIFIPMLGIIMIILIIMGLRLPGASEGVKFLLMPDATNFTLGSLQIALGQALYALGVGIVVLFVFGSYMKDPKENIGKTSVITASSLVIAGVLAGFMIFPALFASGYEPTSGPGLMFISLPNVFVSMPGGYAFSILFYLGVMLAMMSTTIGAWEAAVGFFMDQFNWSRKKTVGIYITIGTVIAIITSYNMDIFNIFDYALSNILVTIGALGICIFCGWVWGIDKCVAAMNIKSVFAQNWLKVMIKFVCPAVIIFTFVTQFIQL